MLKKRASEIYNILWQWKHLYYEKFPPAGKLCIERNLNALKSHEAEMQALGNAYLMNWIELMQIYVGEIHVDLGRLDVDEEYQSQLASVQAIYEAEPEVSAWLNQSTVLTLIKFEHYYFDGLDAADKTWILETFPELIN